MLDRAKGQLEKGQTGFAELSKGMRVAAGTTNTAQSRLANWAGSRHFFFPEAAVAFTGAALAPFFGFFFSLPCELLPLPITHTSVCELEQKIQRSDDAIAYARV